MSAVWSKVSQLAESRRRLIKQWVGDAHFRGAQNHILRLGFAPAGKTSMDALLRPNNRTFLKELLKEVTGDEWKLEMSIVEGLPEPVKRPGSEAETGPPNESDGSFRNDPLIQEALEIFKGEIKSVTN
jgi:hypothetical protein